MLLKYIIAFILAFSPVMVYAQDKSPAPPPTVTMKQWPISCGSLETFDAQIIKGLKMKVLMSAHAIDGNYKILFGNKDGMVILAHMAADGGQICVIDMMRNVNSNITLDYEKL